MSKALNDLDFKMKNLAMEFIARCAESGIPLMIIDTLRTKEEQAENIAKGVSWTQNSLHLPQPGSGLSLAIDVCPYESFSLYGPDKLMWNAEDPVWGRIGAIGERLGLGWGGRWERRDMGHFEYRSLSNRAGMI